MLNALDTLIDAGLTDTTLNGIIEELIEASEGNHDDMRCLVALAWSRGQGNNIGPADVSVSCGDVVNMGGAGYRVLTEYERDMAWEEFLESMLDDCVEGSDGPYFDREAWKRDARMDGAGGLAGYDGHEEELGDWFLYRVS